MTAFRNHLPQLDGELFLTDGGLETTLIWGEHLDLPHFAAFDLLRRPEGVDALRRYFSRYLAIAQANHAGFILESPTWRASADWGDKLGYSRTALADTNRQAIKLMVELQSRHASHGLPIVISGCVGPRGDGYAPGLVPSPDEAEAYHAEQVAIFADTEADMVTAITMTSSAEAAGLARAARSAGMPAAISFTVETDGRLPTGETLDEAIVAVDEATDAAPAYYMINCAHPGHFERALADCVRIERLRGLRANASRCSHAELDEAIELDDGDPVELGLEYARIVTRWPHINVLGGCCGTDHRHIERIAHACRAARPEPRREIAANQ